MIHYQLGLENKKWLQTLDHKPYGEITDKTDILVYPMLCGERSGWTIGSESLLVFADPRNAVDWVEANRWFYRESFTLMGATEIEIALFCQRTKCASYTIEDRGVTVPCL